MKSSRFSKPRGPSQWAISSIRRRAASGRRTSKRGFQYARALMRLAAEDYETYKIVFEVRSLLKPQSALREPELASRVMSMMAVA